MLPSLDRARRRTVYSINNLILQNLFKRQTNLTCPMTLVRIFFIRKMLQSFNSEKPSTYKEIITSLISSSRRNCPRGHISPLFSHQRHHHHIIQSSRHVNNKRVPDALFFSSFSCNIFCAMSTSRNIMSFSDNLGRILKLFFRSFVFISN